MFERFNINEGVTITIDKDIPVSAGLAGGSAMQPHNERVESIVWFRSIFRRFSCIRHTNRHRYTFLYL